MPKVSLSFTIPEEQEECTHAQMGAGYASAMLKFDEYLRKIVKYGSEQEQKLYAVDVRQQFKNILEEEGVEI